MNKAHSLLNQAITPNTARQLWYWLIFEPALLRQFSKNLSYLQRIQWLLNAFAELLLLFSLFLLIRLVFVIWIVDTNLPEHYPYLFRPSTLELWQIFIITNANEYEKVWILFLHGLPLIFLISCIATLLFGVFQLTMGLAFGLAFSVIASLGYGLIYGWLEGLIFGLFYSFVYEDKRGVMIGFYGSFFLAIITGSIYGLPYGLGMSLGFLIGWYLFYFRLFFYPFHVVSCLFRHDLFNNPYIHDAVIWLPIWGLQNRLTQQAQINPAEGQQFFQFLLEHRPLQRNLAAHIAHAIAAGHWQQDTLNANSLVAPAMVEEAADDLRPTEIWYSALDNLRKQLQLMEYNNKLTIQLELFIKLQKQLDEFYQITVNQPSNWSHYYLHAIQKYQTAANQEYEHLQQRQQNLKRIMAATQS